jgi:hypothetical protein
MTRVVVPGLRSRRMSKRMHCHRVRPERRVSLVEEGSTRIGVDESGSWRAVWLGDRPRWSLATKVALGG